jgi:small subunit ribosomal protein S4
VNKPSILVRPGDVITVRKRPNLRKMYEGILESSGSIQPTDWINFDAKELTAIVTTLPMIEDVSLPVDVGQVVAFMSR